MNMLSPSPRAITSHVPKPGDIVLVGFPYPTAEQCQTRIPRPCLIIDVEDYLGGQFAEVLPGTQALLPAPGSSDIFVDATAFSASAPMRGDWHFIAALHERFDIRHPGFAMTDAGARLHLGRVYGSTLDTIDHLRGQLHATRELHVAYRRARRASQRGT